MRSSLRVRQLLSSPLSRGPPFSSPNHATYSLGLSYASKNSPPFVAPDSRAPRYGFAGTRYGSGPSNGKKTEVGEWVERALSTRAGRGELSSAAAGGWTEEMQREVGKWGAGEDFFCLYEPPVDENEPSGSRKRLTHLALSDGVGGWSDYTDPSFFSQMLMYQYVKSVSQPDRGEWEPLQHLREAFKALLKDPLLEAGGGTACAVSLAADGLLRGINMGDSGLSILRDGKIFWSAQPLTHYFNCPKQLSKIPAGMSGVITDSLDDPSAYETFKHQLLPGDIVLLYTDGFSDNVPPTHISLLADRVDKLLSSPDNAHLSYEDLNAERARLLADVMVGYGRLGMQRTGQEQGWKTPFELEAKRNGMNYPGGKVDDITVIAAVVGERHPEDDVPRAKL